MKRNRVRMGDVFYMKIDEDKYAYGQVITEEYPHLFVFFRLLSDHPLTDIDTVVLSEVWFKAFTFNECLREGIWVKMGNQAPSADILLPVFKVETLDGLFLIDYKGKILRPMEIEEENMYSYKCTYSPRLIEGCIRFFYGVEVGNMTDLMKETFGEILSGADMKQP